MTIEIFQESPLRKGRTGEQQSRKVAVPGKKREAGIEEREGLRIGQRFPLTNRGRTDRESRKNNNY